MKKFRESNTCRATTIEWKVFAINLLTFPGLTTKKMNRSAAVVRLCSSSPHLLLLIHDLVHDWGRVARQLHTVRCPRLSPAPASRLCHGRELRSPMAGRIGCGMDRARGRAPCRLPWPVPVVRPRRAKRRASAASPSRGAGGGREAVAAGRRSRRGVGLERNITKGWQGWGRREGARLRGADASTITVTQATCTTPFATPLEAFQ